MHAKNRRNSRIAQISSNRLIGGDHGLFDKRRRIGFATNSHADGHAFIVQADLGLFTLEIHASTTHAIGVKCLSDFMQNANRLRDVFGKRASHRPQGRNRRLKIASLQSVNGNLHGAIRKPRFRLDDRASRTKPFSSMSISTLIARRSSCGRSEHTSFESASGSMGSTRSTKYTLVARSRASKST